MHSRSRPLVGKYAFTVHDLSDNIRAAKFQKCTGLAMTLNIGEYSEGGAIAPMKEITRATFANCTLEHGVFENTEIYDWVTDCLSMLAAAPEGMGIASPDQLRSFVVRQRRRDRSILRNVELYNAQPAAFHPGEFDNTSNDVQVETLELAYEWFHVREG